ncbi:hypothetical protein GCM10028807_20470 [Spirosoma daeguense]
MIYLYFRSFLLSVCLLFFIIPSGILEAKSRPATEENPVGIAASCEAPDVLSTTVLSGSSAQLSWIGYGSVNTYTLEWRQQGSATFTSVTSLTTSAYTLTDLTPGATYEWRVSSVCSATATSVPSALKTFLTDCSSVPTSLTSNSIQASSVTLSWQIAAPIPPGYAIQFRPQGSSTWSNPVTVTTTTYSLTGLASNTPYEWQVQGVCSASFTSTYAAPASFTTLACTNPATNVQTQAGYTRAALSWINSINTASTYAIQYRLQGETSWTTAPPPPVAQANFSMSYSLSGLTTNTAYEWTLTRVCSAMESATAIGPISFTTTCRAPNTPTTSLNKPTSRQVLWFDQFNTGLYELQWRQQGSETWANSLTVNSSSTSSNYTLTNLDIGSAYEVRVSSICSAAESSSFTAPVSFTTATCNAPTSINVNQISSSGSRLNWIDANAVGTYEIQWRQQGDPDWPNSVTVTSTTTSSSYTLVNLNPSTGYQARVNTVCSAAASSTFTNPLNFTTSSCSTPNLFTPTPSATSALLNWSNSGTGVTYNLRYRPQGSETWITVSGVTSSPYTLTGLTNNTTYVFQVQSACGVNATSSYSNSTTFTTSCNVPTLPAVVTTYSNSAILGWVSSNTTFDLYWREQGATSWNNTTLTTGAPQRYNLTGLTPSTGYQWQVRTKCTNTEFSALTSISNFTTADCTEPTNLSAIRNANSATLQWTTPAPNTPHELQWRQQGSTTWNSVSNLIGTLIPFNTNRFSYSLTGLMEATGYEFRMSVFCTPGSSSTFSAPASFTTLGCATPLNGGSNTPRATNVTLTWTNNGAMAYNIRWRLRGGTTAWTAVNNLTGSTYVLQGLTPSTLYEYQIQAVCSDATSSTFSSTINFSTTSCTTPVLSQARATPTTARLDWTPTASNYTVEYRAMPAGSCLSNTTNPANPWTTAVAGITANTLSLSGLTTETCYQWRVTGACSTTYLSQTGYFTTGCNQPPTGLTARSTAGTSAQLNWDDLGGGAQYEVQWRVNGTNVITGDGSCVNNATNNANPWNTVSNISSSNYQLNGLNLSSCYQWRVRVQCNGGPFSDVSAFRTSGCAPVSITQQPPASATVSAGSSTSASVTATGAPPLIYQWFKGGTAPGNILSGQTNATLSLTNVQANDADTYYCLISNDCSSTLSTGFTLTVSVGGCQSGFYTVQNGAWNVASTWSCGQIPTSADPVDIRHVVSIPASYTGLAQKITYSSGGKISMATTGKVRVGP